jgi:hypothetical protein
MKRMSTICLVVSLMMVSTSCGRIAEHELETRHLEFTADDMVKVAHRGSVDDVRLFLRAGMSPNVVGSPDPSSRKVSPLFAASEGCAPEVAAILLRAGADVAFTSSWKQSCLVAAATGCQAASDDDARQLAEMLIDAGAPLEIADSSGQTALVVAIEVANLEMVRSLVVHGANLRIRVRGVPLIEAAARERGEGEMVKGRRERIVALLREAQSERVASAKLLTMEKARERLASIGYELRMDNMSRAAASGDVEALALFLKLDPAEEWTSDAFDKGRLLPTFRVRITLLRKGRQA